MTAHLQEISDATVRRVCRLDAGDGGRQVAPNAASIAQAYFEPAAWFRAIVVDDEPVGFPMLYDPTLSPAPEESQFTLWRLMIDQRWQNRGYGRAAVEQQVGHVRTRPGADALHVSHVKGVERSARFHLTLGFEYAGEEDEGELVMRRLLR